MTSGDPSRQFTVPVGAAEMPRRPGGPPAIVAELAASRLASFSEGASQGALREGPGPLQPPGTGGVRGPSGAIEPPGPPGGSVPSGRGRGSATEFLSGFQTAAEMHRRPGGPPEILQMLGSPEMRGGGGVGIREGRGGPETGGGVVQPAGSESGGAGVLGPDSGPPGPPGMGGRGAPGAPLDPALSAVLSGELGGLPRRGRGGGGRGVGSSLAYYQALSRLSGQTPQSVLQIIWSLSNQFSISASANDYAALEAETRRQMEFIQLHQADFLRREQRRLARRWGAHGRWLQNDYAHAMRKVRHGNEAARAQAYAAANAQAGRAMTQIRDAQQQVRAWTGLASIAGQRVAFISGKFRRMSKTTRSRILRAAVAGLRKALKAVSAGIKNLQKAIKNALAALPKSNDPKVVAARASFERAAEKATDAMIYAEKAADALADAKQKLDEGDLDGALEAMKWVKYWTDNMNEALAEAEKAFASGMRTVSANVSLFDLTTPLTMAVPQPGGPQPGDGQGSGDCVEGEPCPENPDVCSLCAETEKCVCTWTKKPAKEDDETADETELPLQPPGEPPPGPGGSGGGRATVGPDLDPGPKVAPSGTNVGGEQVDDKPSDLAIGDLAGDPEVAEQAYKEMLQRQRDEQAVEEYVDGLLEDAEEDIRGILNGISTELLSDSRYLSEKMRERVEAARRRGQSIEPLRREIIESILAAAMSDPAVVALGLMHTEATTGIGWAATRPNDPALSEGTNDARRELDKQTYLILRDLADVLIREAVIGTTSYLDLPTAGMGLLGDDRYIVRWVAAAQLRGLARDLVEAAYVADALYQAVAVVEYGERYPGKPLPENYLDPISPVMDMLALRGGSRFQEIVGGSDPFGQEGIRLEGFVEVAPPRALEWDARRAWEDAYSRMLDAYPERDPVWGANYRKWSQTKSNWEHWWNTFDAAGGVIALSFLTGEGAVVAARWLIVKIGARVAARALGGGAAAAGFSPKATTLGKALARAAARTGQAGLGSYIGDYTVTRAQELTLGRRLEEQRRNAEIGAKLSLALGAASEILVPLGRLARGVRSTLADARERLKVMRGDRGFELQGYAYEEMAATLERARVAMVPVGSARGPRRQLVHPLYPSATHQQGIDIAGLVQAPDGTIALRLIEVKGAKAASGNLTAFENVFDANLRALSPSSAAHRQALADARDVILNRGPNNVAEVMVIGKVNLPSDLASLIRPTRTNFGVALQRLGDWNVTGLELAPVSRLQQIWHAVTGEWHYREPIVPGGVFRP